MTLLIKKTEYNLKRTRIHRQKGLLANGIRRLTLILLVVFLFGTFIGTCFASENHTLLMYILGSDLEEFSGAVTEDLMEIKRISADIPIRVIAYIGGSQRWWLPGLQDNHCYDVEICNGEIIVLNDWGIQNSAEPEQLKRFLETFASNGDDLILWGHGLPGFDGIGTDTQNQDDNLSLAEIHKAIEDTRLHFHVLGFDACEMATLETAWFFSKNADYFIASPEIESLSGWDYRSVLPALQQDDETMVCTLRSCGLQNAKRNSSDLFLTVIDERQFESCAIYINRILDTCSVHPDPITLLDIAATCSDQEAGKKIIETLNGQKLTVSDQTFDNAPVLSGIHESYVSFINRR